MLDQFASLQFIPIIQIIWNKLDRSWLFLMRFSARSTTDFLILAISQFLSTVCWGRFKQKVMLRPKDHHSMKEYPIWVQNHHKLKSYKIAHFLALFQYCSSWALWAVSLGKFTFLKKNYYIPDFLGFQYLGILDLHRILFHAVVIFVPKHDFFFKSASTYCDALPSF